MSHSRGTYSGTKYFSLNSFYKFKNSYLNFIDSINGESNFIKVNNNSEYYCGLRSEKKISISIYNNLIKSTENYISLWKFFSTIPTLKLSNPGLAMHNIEENFYEYDSSFIMPSDKLTFPVRTRASQVDHCKHVHIIKEGSTYFIKFDFKSKYSDYEKASKVLLFSSKSSDTVSSDLKISVIELMEWDTIELYDDFFEDSILDNYELTRFVEDGIVSNYIIFELPNFAKTTEMGDALLKIPFTFFDYEGLYPIKEEDRYHY